MGKKIKDLKGKFHRKADDEAQKRLRAIGVLDSDDDVVKYKPKRLRLGKSDTKKAYGDFAKEGDRFENTPFSRSSGRFKGGTVKKYRNKQGKLKYIKDGARTADNSGGTRAMGGVQEEAAARYKKSAAFVRGSRLDQLKGKLAQRKKGTHF